MGSWLKNLIAVLCFVFQATCGYAVELPPLQGRVNDYAGVLTSEQKQTLEDSLAKIESYEGHPQVVILTTKNLHGMSMEQYSLSVARAWGIGQRKTNNGLLITTYVAPGKEFRVRIEVGYGLEGIIPDATARAIYNQTMRPHFRKEGSEDYMAAYTGAISAIDALLRKELTGNPSIDEAVTIEKQQKTVSQILNIGIVVAVLAGYIHWIGCGAVGSVTATALGLTLGWTWVLFPFFAVLGFFAGIFVHFVARTLLSGQWNGIGYGGGSGGSFGGGGFRGGGGSFGGGGYSGGR